MARRVVLIGVGNIGSFLVTQLAHLRGVDEVLLVDRDVYDEDNRRNQLIAPADVGRPKARVQTRRLLRLRPELRVAAWPASVESLPLGELLGDLVLTCVDSRGTRQYVNQVLWRLGVPWIDAGVEADHGLARVSLYLPGPERPCLECSWDDRHYADLEQRYACDAGEPVPAPTGAAASLGALAAALQAIEAQRVLDCGAEPALFGREIVVGTRHHGGQVTELTRRSGCRLEHSVWAVGRLEASARETTLADALALAPPGIADVGLRVEGKAFARGLICPRCGKERSLLRLESALGTHGRCPDCERPMLADERLDRLEADRLGARTLRRSLHSVGVRDGEVLSVGGHGLEKHFRVGAEDSRRRDRA